jgi:hypothetical protein
VQWDAAKREDVKVIVHTPWAGEPTSLIEDQVTYPIVTKLLAAPHVKAVRAQTMFGDSYVFVHIVPEIAAIADIDGIPFAAFDILRDDGRSSRNTSEVQRHGKNETRAAAHNSPKGTI